jgi:cysteine desulfurase
MTTKRIYLDYASLTPVDKRVLGTIKKYQSLDYGNPSALYASGVAAKKALDEARLRVAKVIHAHPDEIVFTGSGTEANNLAIFGVGEGQIIVSDIEHSSIREIAKERGVVFIPVDKNGIVDLEILKKSITTETKLVSMVMVNNEIGTIEPLQEIAKITRHFRKQNNSIYPLFHTDACQAPCVLPVHVEKLGVDMLTLDSHKIYGPRGVGMLYIRRGLKLNPIIYGGGQEKGLRSGTENIPGIAGFAHALELADKMRDKEVARLAELKEYFIQGLLKINSKIIINGENTSPHILNISIPGIDNEFFVLQLDARGIECSTKSACLKDEDESYVLQSMGGDSKTSIRFSFGRQTTKKDLKKVLNSITI